MVQFACPLLGLFVCFLVCCTTQFWRRWDSGHRHLLCIGGSGWCFSGFCHWAYAHQSVLRDPIGNSGTIVFKYSSSSPVVHACWLVAACRQQTPHELPDKRGLFRPCFARLLPDDDAKCSGLVHGFASPYCIHIGELVVFASWVV